MLIDLEHFSVGWKPLFILDAWPDRYHLMVIHFSFILFYLSGWTSGAYSSHIGILLHFIDSATFMPRSLCLGMPEKVQQDYVGLVRSSFGSF